MILFLLAAEFLWLLLKFCAQDECLAHLTFVTAPQSKDLASPDTPAQVPAPPFQDPPLSLGLPQPLPCGWCPVFLVQPREEWRTLRE